MTNFLSQPYPFDRRWQHQLRVAAWSSLFVTLFLLLFKPFGIGNYQDPGLELKIVGYGVLTFGVLFCVFLLMRWLRRSSDDEAWTTGKEIVSILVYIFFLGIANALY